MMTMFLPPGAQSDSIHWNRSVFWALTDVARLARLNTDTVLQGS